MLIVYLAFFLKNRFPKIYKIEKHHVLYFDSLRMKCTALFLLVEEEKNHCHKKG